VREAIRWGGMIAAGGALVMGVELFDMGWRTGGLDDGEHAERVLHSAGHCSNLAEKPTPAPYHTHNNHPPLFPTNT